MAGLLLLWLLFLLLSYYLDLLFSLPNPLPFPLSLSGLVFVVAGLALWGRCFYLFRKIGGGTPSPTHPTQRLVTVGPYRYVRNPIYVSFLVTNAGLGLLLSLTSIFPLIALFWALSHVFVVFYEEPRLQWKFGQEFSEYKSQVPRWIPFRLKKR